MIGWKPIDRAAITVVAALGYLVLSCRSEYQLGSGPLPAEAGDDSSNVERGSSGSSSSEIGGGGSATAGMGGSAGGDGSTGGILAGGTGGAARGNGDAAGNEAGGTGGAVGEDGGLSCTGGTVTFNLAAADGADYCTGVVQCSSWIAFTTDARQPITPLLVDETQTASNLCKPDCAECQPVFCGVFCESSSLIRSAQITLDGTYLSNETCGSMNLSCGQLRCATVGSHFIATMCAYANATGPDSGAYCTGAAPLICTEVAFDYVAGTTVTGTLSPK